jgi:hypothetical protein
MPQEPYKVVKERHACEMCGYGLLWTVQGPTGDAGGTSYEVESDAYEEANALNHAYELGYKAGREED